MHGPDRRPLGEPRPPGSPAGDDHPPRAAVPAVGPHSRARAAAVHERRLVRPPRRRRVLGSARAGGSAAELRHAGLDAYLLQGIGAEQMHVLKPYLDEKYHVVHYLHPNTGTADGVAAALRRERLEPISSRSVVMWASKSSSSADGRRAARRAPSCAPSSGCRACASPSGGRPHRRDDRARAADPAGAPRAAPRLGLRLPRECDGPRRRLRLRRRRRPGGEAATCSTRPPATCRRRSRRRRSARSRVGTAASASRLYFSEECVVKRTTLTERFVDVCSKPLPGTAHRVCAAEEGRASGVGGEARRDEDLGHRGDGEGEPLPGALTRDRRGGREGAPRERGGRGGE